MTDFMVIGRVRDSNRITTLVEGIEARGYSCYNFLHKPATPNKAHLSWAEQMNELESHPDFWNDPVHHDHFQTDLAGLLGATTVVLLAPAGLAAHMEIGIAYGKGKKLVLVGDVEKPETLYLMFNEAGNERFPTIDAFLASLKAKAAV